MESDRVISRFCSAIQDGYSDDIFLLWEKFREYSLEYPELFESEESVHRWFIDELCEIYHLPVEEVEQVNWIYESIKRNIFSQPPNG